MGAGVWFDFRRSRFSCGTLRIEKTLFSSVSKYSRLYLREPL
jgi:hypothetical protein